MNDQDTLAITYVINLYGFAIDTQRFDLFDRIFTPDIHADYSESAQWRDVETFKSDFVAYYAPFDGTQHAMMNHLIDVAGDSANAVTYATWRLIRKGTDGGDFWEGTGWYDDTLVRTAAGWRIRKRSCRIIWWGGNPLVNAAVPGVAFELPTTSLCAEGKAGNVPFLEAIAAR